MKFKLSAEEALQHILKSVTMKINLFIFSVHTACIKTNLLKMDLLHKLNLSKNKIVEITIAIFGTVQEH